MPALADYLDLRFAVSDHVGNRNLSDVMPRLVQTAEAYLNKELRCRQQVTYATLVFAQGAAPLPADFLEIITVFDDFNNPMRATQLADQRRLGSMYSRYSIDGTNININGYTGNRDIQYYAKLATLTAGPTTSNWLLADAPDVYLAAVGLEAAKFLKDVELVLATRQLLSEALSELKVADERARWSNSVVRVQGCTP